MRDGERGERERGRGGDGENWRLGDKDDEFKNVWKNIGFYFMIF